MHVYVQKNLKQNRDFVFAELRELSIDSEAITFLTQVEIIVLPLQVVVSKKHGVLTYFVKSLVFIAPFIVKITIWYRSID